MFISYVGTLYHVVSKLDITMVKSTGAYSTYYGHKEHGEHTQLKCSF